MKASKQQLRKIIREEKAKILLEMSGGFASERLQQPEYVLIAFRPEDYFQNPYLAGKKVGEYRRVVEEEIGWFTAELPGEVNREKVLRKRKIVEDNSKHGNHRLLSFFQKELILYYYYNVYLVSVLSYSVSQSLDHLNSDCTTKQRTAVLLLISRLCYDRYSSYSIHGYLLLVVLFQQEKLVF